MGLDGATLKRLREQASGFVTKNHRSYLSEALACLRETNDPVAALRLLHAMWGSYASRDPQQRALNDVGKWLEDRLQREPRVEAATIATELGWLRRMAQVAGAPADREGAEDRALRGAPAPMLAFGKRIEGIAARRAVQPTRQAPPPRTAPPVQPAAPPAPTALPPVFEAEFVRFDDAREARRTARKRQQAGKSPKDRLLDVRPTDPRLVPLAAGLACSILETRGFDAPFEVAERDDGKPSPFYVTAIEERDGKKLVRVMALHPPDGKNTGATA